MLDARSLWRHLESLDRTARELGVRPLSEFFSLPLEEVAKFMDGGDGIELPPLRNFPALDGLATVRALLAHHASQAGEVVQELRQCERILSRAAERGVGWHLQSGA